MTPAHPLLRAADLVVEDEVASAAVEVVVEVDLVAVEVAAVVGLVVTVEDVEVAEVDSEDGVVVLLEGEFRYT